MTIKEYHFEFEEYLTIDELSQQDASILLQARNLTKNAYAPYSNFKVASVALLENGEWVTGTNQENSSYPVGICAERTLLSSAGTLFPNVPITTMAISYEFIDSLSQPIFPCGMCRQSLFEFEQRTNSPIRLLLSGQFGKVIVIRNCFDLMPFGFKISV